MPGLRYHASVATDIVLRTTLASAIGGVLTSVPLNVERDALERYAALTDAADPAPVFRSPEHTDVSVRAREAPMLRDGHLELLRFPSTFAPVDSAVAHRYSRYTANMRGYAKLWRHDEGGRPTLCVIHGFGASPIWFNARFFSLLELFDEGWDVLFFTLPFHGPRSSMPTAVNGLELFSHGLSVSIEALLHAVHDFRVLHTHLLEQGSPDVGVTGLSLGGYIAALLAAVERDLSFVIPNAPVVSIPMMLPVWFPAGRVATMRLRRAGIPASTLARALSVHSPLTYPALVPHARRMIVGGLGDRLAPPDQSRLLWEHWNRPRIHWFEGSHLIHFGRRDYLTGMREVMEAEG